jgi:flagellin
VGKDAPIIKEDGTMGLRIANNITAMTTHRWLSKADQELGKSLERLSSGYRINRAADDAAGLSISSRFRAQIASLQVASRNTSEANALIQVAEGGMNEINNVLTRLKELATQASSSNVSSTDISKINAESNELLTEIDRIAASTKYGGTALLNTAYSGTFQVGDENATDSRISFQIQSVTTAGLGLGTIDIMNTQANAQAALATIDSAISTLADRRGNLGAVQNRLSWAAANLASTVENYQAAESVIRDVDMAWEVTNFTKNQILLQSGTAMLAQANMSSQTVLQLFG